MPVFSKYVVVVVHEIGLCFFYFDCRILGKLFRISHGSILDRCEMAHNGNECVVDFCYPSFQYSESSPVVNTSKFSEGVSFWWFPLMLSISVIRYLTSEDSRIWVREWYNEREELICYLVNTDISPYLNFTQKLKNLEKSPHFFSIAKLKETW